MVIGRIFGGRDAKKTMLHRAADSFDGQRTRQDDEIPVQAMVVNTVLFQRPLIVEFV